MPSYHKKQGVVLDVRYEPKVEAIGAVYYQKTNKMITVTSGERLPHSQASAMYDKMAAGSDLSDYIAQGAAQQIRKVYLDGTAKGEDRAKIVGRMASVIDQQVQMGVYISKHLRSGAVDVRSRDMTSAQLKIFETAARKQAVSVELEKFPPHWHLQF